MTRCPCCGYVRTSRGICGPCRVGMRASFRLRARSWFRRGLA